MTVKQLKSLLDMVPEYTELLIASVDGKSFRRIYTTDYGAIEEEDPVLKSIPDMLGKLAFVIY